MKFRTRILIIVAAALVGMIVMALSGLFQLRQSMYQERQSQIVQLLDVASAQLKYFSDLEASGKLTRDEAQARAKEAITAQRTKDNYFIVRNVADNMLLVHGTASRVGKIDPPESMQMRINRIYRGVQYRPVTHTYLIPAPFAGTLGGKPMPGDQVMDWVSDLLHDFAWKPQPRKA